MFLRRQFIKIFLNAVSLEKFVSLEKLDQLETFTLITTC